MFWSTLIACKSNCAGDNCESNDNIPCNTVANQIVASPDEKIKAAQTIKKTRDSTRIRKPSWKIRDNSDAGYSHINYEKHISVDDKLPETVIKVEHQKQSTDTVHDTNCPNSIVESEINSTKKLVKTRNRAGCDSCKPCITPNLADCGKCHFCKDKKKFGGPDKLRKKCIHRTCRNKSFKRNASASEAENAGSAEETHEVAYEVPKSENNLHTEKRGADGVADVADGVADGADVGAHTQAVIERAVAHMCTVLCVLTESPKTRKLISKKVLI